MCYLTYMLLIIKWVSWCDMCYLTYMLLIIKWVSCVDMCYLTYMLLIIMSILMWICVMTYMLLIINVYIIDIKWVSWCGYVLWHTCYWLNEYLDVDIIWHTCYDHQYLDVDMCYLTYMLLIIKWVLDVDMYYLTYMLLIIKWVSWCGYVDFI